MSKHLKEAKTVFLGLDAVGKTSIISFLEKKLVKGKSMKPTVGAEITTQKISLLGVEIYHWDLGGQEQYRQQYYYDSGKHLDYSVKRDKYLYR